MVPRKDAGGFKSRIRPPYPQRVVNKTNLGGVSESPYKKVGPVSVFGRARKRTLRNVYDVWSPTVGPTSSSVRLHIYVPSHM